MTAKQEAEELYNEFHFVLPSYHDEGQQEHQAAKQCAYIAVNKLLKYSKAHGFIGLTEHYKQVKIEIEKL
jgi:hypothetical protein